VTQCVGLDAVDGDPLPVDLDHRDPLAVAALEIRDVRDVDLVHLEAELAGERAQLGARPLAEVAVTGDDERDARAQGYSPRIVLASATLETASPYAAIRIGTSRAACTSQVSL